MARIASRLKLGYYPLPNAEAQRIRQHLDFTAACAAIDPCAGTGAALLEITAGAPCGRYGVELDSVRAGAASRVLDRVTQGSVFEVHAPVDSFALLYLNPPYDEESIDDRSHRTEAVFLDHCYRWLQPGGVLAFVVPGKQLGRCTQVLASNFKDIRVYRLTEPESVRFGQVVLFAIRRSRRERDRLRDAEVSYCRRQLMEAAVHWSSLPPLTCPTDARYSVPAGGRDIALSYRGLPLDLVEDLLPSSRAYAQAARILFAPPIRVAGRPLTPLHEGHAGILSCCGLLDGLFGRGKDRHLACWQARKVVDRLEETDDAQVTTIRERERFTQSLTLIYADGRTAELSEDPDAERSPTGRPA